MLLVCLALIAAGCGSSGGGSADGTGPSTSSGATETEPGETTHPEGGPRPGAAEQETLEQLPKAPEASGPPPTLASSSRPDERTYLTAVFEDAQSLWQQEFAGAGRSYAPARLILFSRAVQSACGAQADVGPFYCGADRGIYLDLRFFESLALRFGVGGFAQAYLVGHEFGHHVQALLGLPQRVAVANQQNPSGANALSVRVELQADCLAGIWAHSVYRRGELTEADVEQALRAAAVIGDDFQARMAGHVVDSSLWTHGSSAQRQRWLVIGFDSGEPASCDTFTQPVG